MGNILYRKGVLILPTVANSCCFFPFWSFPLSSPFFCFSFSQSFKITTALLMYLEDDYPLRLGFCSWTHPGEPHHPRCNRQEQKEWRGKERREARIPLSYNKENSQIFTTTHPSTPSTSAIQPAWCEDSSILILPGERDILRHIDHSLLTAVINSDNSELNEKFYFYLSVALLLAGVRCPSPTPSHPPTYPHLVWHRCCPSPSPTTTKSNI